MNSRIIRGRSGSDFHLGSNTTPIEYIVESLDRLMTNDKVYSENELIIFAGDILHRLLTHPSKEAKMSRDWMTRAIDLGIKHHTTILSLEGTPMHDWKQSKFMQEFNNTREQPADFHYAERVTIEYIESLDIHVLFVPDEAHDNCKLTEIAVMEQLKLHGIEQVDLTIIHGQFPHHFPPHVRDKGMDFHDPDFYLGITRHFIFCGHIHTHGIYKRIVTHGSIERLDHGYESPKGVVGFELHLDDPSKSRCWFIENKGAMTYRTIKIGDVGLEEAITQVREEACRYSDGSHLRISAKANHPITALLREFKREFPMFHWTMHRDKDKGKKTKVDEVATPRVVRSNVMITSDNIKELLSEKLSVYSEEKRINILRVLEKCK
jgi:hypothetical protein